MNYGFRIVRYQGGRRGVVYTVHIDEQPRSEFDDFLQAHENAGLDDFDRLLAKLAKMLADWGFRSQLFADERGVKALKADEAPRHLRLYCFPLGTTTLIVGNGAVKPPTARTFQQVPFLKACVEELEYVADRLAERLRSREVYLTGKGELRGDLYFPPLD